MADSCMCGEKPTLIFACSGGSDVGELSDRVARRLGKDGKGKMYCLAGLGAGLSGMIESSRSAKELIVIDGCPVACGKKILEKVGLPAKFFNLKDIGYEKGKTPCTEGTINEVVAKLGVKG